MDKYNVEKNLDYTLDNNRFNARASATLKLIQDGSNNIKHIVETE